MSDKGNFFAIDRRAWRRVCRLGMNAMVTYLVLARGTGWDNLTTGWSVHAVEKWSGISRARAREAHDALVRAGLTVPREGKPGAIISPACALPNTAASYSPAQVHVLDMVKAGEQIPVRIPRGWKEPRSPRDIALSMVATGDLYALGNHHYEMVEGEMGEPEWIWLPNSLVTGAAREVPPVELVRQSQSPTALRLLVEMYDTHALRADGGIHWRAIRRAYERSYIGDRAQFKIYAFKATSIETWGATAFVRPYLTGVQKDQKDAGWGQFWKDFGSLRNLGLVEFVPHVIEADTDTAEILHPFCMNGDEAENKVSEAAARAAWAMLSSVGHVIAQERQATGASIVACPAHVENVALVGIARLRYKPKTRATAAWHARASEYHALAEGFAKAVENITGTRKDVA
jgi:hypothetical protein